MQLPRRVTITEVGPRDGLQAEAIFVETPQKIAFINALAQTGLTRIEATSFVHPRAIPALRDASQVMAGLERPPGVTYLGLVPNLVGAQRALEARVDEFSLFLSASESHNRANVNMTIAESLRGFEPVMQLAKEAKVPIRGSIATAFGCPYEGKVPPQKVIEIGRTLRDLGMDIIALADTTGMANPRQVAELVSTFRAQVPGVGFALHFHDTRGAGLANILAALQLGATDFDASVGGLGGCPYAPGATGNVATEDVVHMLHEMGIETGIDLDKLLACARMARDLVGHDLLSHVFKAGKASDLAKMAAREG